MQVTARVDLKPRPKSRPPSPTKQSPTSPSLSSFRPKAKLNTDATVRKLASSNSPSQTRNAPPSRSRPGSPFKPPRVLPNGSGPNGSPKARVMARPTSRGPAQINSNSLESRQRALTSASAKLKLPHLEDRPRSGSVIALHHAVSLSDISSPTLSRPPPTLVDINRTITPPILAPIKIKSKVTDFVKTTSNPGDTASRSLSPPYATTRPIHARTRAPSISSSFSLNDPSPSPFYPITSGSPAANPHRYAPLRAPSPARSYPLPTLSLEPQPTRKSILIPKADLTSAPIPPHSPPISALSLSSKSSASRTSVSLNTDQTSDNQVSSAMSHAKRHSIDRVGQPSPLFPQGEFQSQTRRDRSRSRERSPLHRADSDVESDGSERQLRAEAKTNRKIADLEITNRSLLAINASLETTKNQQAKEIRDLRRKLRESRLILPPTTFRAVQSALEDGNDEDDCDDGSDEEDEDETFQRVRGLIDNLIEAGKRALEMRPEDFRASLATKVLNADELRSWQDSGQRPSMRMNYINKQDADDRTTQGLLYPVFVTMPDSDGASSAESDGELASNSRGSSTLPPITITHSL